MMPQAITRPRGYGMVLGIHAPNRLADRKKHFADGIAHPNWPPAYLLLLICQRVSRSRKTPRGTLAVLTGVEETQPVAIGIPQMGLPPQPRHVSGGLLELDAVNP